MELQFEHIVELATGVNPAVVHLANGDVYLFSVLDGRLMYRKWEPLSGDVPWDEPAFATQRIGTTDKNMSLIRLKNVPRVGIFGAWHQDEVYIDDELVTPERHRFAIWDDQNDLSKYVQNCTIEMVQGNPIATIRVSLDNPSQYVSGEDKTRLVPGMRIEPYVTFGNSEEYPLGVQYIDRVSMGVTKGTADVEGRSITGKLLRDQTFDENNVFPYRLYYLNIVQLLEDAGITAFDVQPNPDQAGWKFGIEFPPEMNRLDGLTQMIKASLNWDVIETLDGVVLAGSRVTFGPMQINSTYTFQRGRDVWSRDIVRDDEVLYSRVCARVKAESNGVVTTSYYYADVEMENAWILAPNRTLHINLPDGTGSDEAQEVITEIAGRLSRAGVIETFVGPLRPQLLVGDTARIIAEDATSILGIITTVKHTLGRSGFMTEFTVDSGGERGKLSIQELIRVVSGGSAGGSSNQGLVIHEEGGTGTGTGGIVQVGVPGGGQAGQALRKNSSTGFDIAWEDVHEVPAGGDAGQVLKKNSSTAYDTYWDSVPVFKRGSGAFTVRGVEQTIIDSVCTADSLVMIVITSEDDPEGEWTVESYDGLFVITSTVSEIADIAFDYYIQREE